MQKLLLLFIANFICIALNAQKLDWKDIDTDIAIKRNLKELTQKIEVEKNIAYQNKAYGFVGRCWEAQMRISDRKKEDTSFFKNSSFIDSIINSDAAPVLKSVMHIMQARRIAYFESAFFYRNNKNLFKNKTGYPNYNNYNKKEIDSTVAYHIEKAASISKEETVNNSIDYLWLSSDPLQFLFKPTYKDIISAEQIALTKNAILAYGFNEIYNWLEKSPDEFIQSIDSFTHKDLKITEKLKLYKAWAFENKTNKEAYYFIELLARKYFFKYTYPNKEVKNIYQAYIEKQIQSSHKAVRVFAVYQRCIFLNSEAINYKDFYSTNYDTSYRDYYNKAIKLFNLHKNAIDSFGFIKDDLVKMKEQILSPNIEITTNENFKPNEKITIKIKYKNVKNIFIKIVRAYAMQDYNLENKKNINLLKLLPTVFEKNYIMPVVEDYQEHNSELDITKLGIGNYYILFSKDSITETNDAVRCLKIKVSNIALIDNNNRVFVLEKTTGFPLKNASLIIQYKNKLKESVNTFKKINKQGYVDIKEKDIVKIYAIFEGDTTIRNIHFDENDNNNTDVYDGETTEDLVDYYLDNMKLQMYTDRSIYRPGQTVHYKGIVTMLNPKNAEPFVLNKQNLKLPFLAKLFNKELKIFFNGESELTISNPFNIEVDTIKIKLNNYGSFSGSFKIPADAANGKWEFDCIDVDEVRNNSSFKVEEYKRPTFELSIEKPFTNVKLGEDFNAKAKVRSFAGASLNNVKINYEVQAKIYYPVYDSLSKLKKNRVFEETIIDSSGFTNENGEFFIKVINDSIRKLPFIKDNFYSISYRVNAEAVDPTGESHEEKLSFDITNRPITIQIKPNNIIEKNEIYPIKINTKESFTKKPIDKKLGIKLFKVEISKSDYKIDNNDFIIVDGKWKFIRPEIKNTNYVNKETLIDEITLNSKDKYILPKEKLTAGRYRIEATCTEDNILIGEGENSFMLLDKDAPLVAGEDEVFHYLKNKDVAVGQKVDWQISNKANDIYSIYKLEYYQKNKNGLNIKSIYDFKEQKRGVQNWSFIVPPNIENSIVLTHVYILNGKVFEKKETIYPKIESKENEIIVEQYRTILTPGAKEKFVISVKTKNQNTAAEIMTTMYDASLDKIEKHEWDLPRFDKRLYINSDWDFDLDDITSSEINKMLYPIEDYTNSHYKSTPLYWLNPMDYAYSELKPSDKYGEFFNDNLSKGLMGKVSGLNITYANGFDEVVVVSGAFGVQRKSVGYSVTTVIRGLSSVDVSNKPLIIIDGVVYNGDLSKIDANSIVEGLILKGADGTALYGAQAATGVIILSTKGPIVLPKQEAPPVVVRKNFSESAFFFPQVHADKDGFYTFNFTMPESVTEWKWKILSHTKNAIFTKIEKTIFTQLPLMVQPNMPRFLYQGDKIILQSRITNLDTVNINGNSICTIEDAVTGENITAKLLLKMEQPFAVQKKSNSNIAYSISVPEDLLHPIKIKVSASTNNFSDGEEYTIPIMSKKILVAQPQQIVFSSKDTTIKTPALLADATPYGISLHIKPKPQGALLNALPYLANYPFNCAEQTFNKLLAHTIATKLMRTDSSLQKMQKQKSATENNTAALPLELSEQTMPWLQLNNSVAKHQKDLSTLLDTLRGNELIKKYFEDLKALQNKDGGMAWFKDGKSDEYISNYILHGFSKVKKEALFSPTVDIKEKYNLFLKELINYCDANFLDSTKKYNNWENVQYINARKFHIADFPLSIIIQNKIDIVLAKNWKSVDNYNLGMQATLIQASMFFGNTKNNFSSMAKAKLESIKQLANNDDAAGIRWKELSNQDDLTISNEEAVVAIAEAFEENGNDTETIDGIIKWLLYAKENHNWSTTKSTADVVSLINRHPSNALNNVINISANVGRINLQVTDNLLKGNLSSFAQTTFSPTINLNKDVADVAISNLNYYYFTATPASNENTSGVKISKQLYRVINDKDELVNENTILKIADKIKTVITIENEKQLKYVFIDEKRAASLEPKDGASGYEYSKGFGYYQSVRDAGYQFFAEQIPSGINTITYYTIVAKEGSFYNGVIALQCMYSPAVKAYGVGSVLKVVQ
jgi:alpha-2-macroglobulin